MAKNYDLLPNFANKKTMKQLRLILTILFTYLLAATQVFGENYENITVTSHQPSHTNTRPRTAGTSDVTCVYNVEEGLLDIEFSNPEGECEVIIHDRNLNENQVYVLDSEYRNTIAIGPDVSGTITIHTEENNTYQGSLSQ